MTKCCCWAVPSCLRLAGQQLMQHATTPAPARGVPAAHCAPTGEQLPARVVYRHQPAHTHNDIISTAPRCCKCASICSHLQRCVSLTAAFLCSHNCCHSLIIL